MFELVKMEKIVALQQKSYTLLQWVGESLRNGTLNFSTVHASMALSDAAGEWVGRNLDSLPKEARPDREELETFAHLFASYLATSFDLVGTPGQRRVSSCWCRCEFCVYLVSANYLRVKTPDKKAREKARQLKTLYLSSLSETGVSVTYPIVETLLSDSGLAEDIAFATYGHELLRRSEFASQGEGVLVLWREIAWGPNGRMKKRFVLTAERILQAETAIVSRLKRVESPGS